MAAQVDGLLKGAAGLLGGGGGDGGGGGGVIPSYSGHNESSIDTPITTSAGGGIGAQRFDFSSRYTKGINPVWLIAGAVVIAFLVFRR